MKSNSGSIPLWLSRPRRLPPKNGPRFDSGVALQQPVYRPRTPLASNPNQPYAGQSKDLAANLSAADHGRLAL